MLQGDFILKLRPGVTSEQKNIQLSASKKKTWNGGREPAAVRVDCRPW